MKTLEVKMKTSGGDSENVVGDGEDIKGEDETLEVRPN